MMLIRSVGKFTGLVHLYGPYDNKTAEKKKAMMDKHIGSANIIRTLIEA